MGIYDREYYRREGPSILGSFADRGKVCKWLIGLNVAAFVLQLLANDPATGDQFTDAFLLDSADVLHGQVWRLLTYAFLHSTQDVGHLLWNMLFLWWFGNEVEDVYGSREFLAFYLVAAVFGGLVHVLVGQIGWMPGYPVIGASGAVTAVLVLCALHYPTKIIYLFMLIPVPIWAFVLFQVGKDFVGFFGRAQTGVAVDVHLAGFLLAVVYFKMEWRFSTLWPALRARRRQARPALRVYRGEDEADRTPVAAPVGPPIADDEQLEAKVDAILEKISRSGKESLTEGERQTLLRASERIKRRRT
jgi:membrane associated rhomboid family serine protease